MCDHWSGLVDQQKVDCLTDQNVIFDIFEPPAFQNALGGHPTPSLTKTICDARTHEHEEEEEEEEEEELGILVVGFS